MEANSNKRQPLNVVTNQVLPRTNIITSANNPHSSVSIETKQKKKKKRPGKTPMVISVSNPLQITADRITPNTRIPCLETHPLVSISDDDDGSDTEDHFRLPLFQMTQEELGEELKVFNTSSDAPKISGDLEFRHAEVSSIMSETQSLIDTVKHEQGQFDVESIFFLDLSSRNLTDVNSLSLCRQLIILNLNNNQLTHVRGLGTLNQLKILSLAQNQLQTLEGLQTCESLEILDVAGNQLQGLKSLSPLLALPNLRSLCLADQQRNLSNPLCQSTSYRQDVKNNLPNLNTLDHQWLGYGFDEQITAIDRTLKKLESSSAEPSLSMEKPRIVITQASLTHRSIERANEEYEELMKMFVK